MDSRPRVASYILEMQRLWGHNGEIIQREYKGEIIHRGNIKGGGGRGRPCFKIVKRVQKLIFKKFRLFPKKVGSGLPKKREAVLNFFSQVPFSCCFSLCQIMFQPNTCFFLSVKYVIKVLILVVTL